MDRGARSARVALRWWTALAAVAAAVLVLVPAATARTDGAKRAAFYHVYVTVTPVVPSDPRNAPPGLGGEADFKVQFSTSVGPCSSVSATMTVTGPNGQVKTGGNAQGVYSYIGKKSGVDTVTFSFGYSVCSGVEPFDVVSQGPTVFHVAWGQNYNGCTLHRPMNGREWTRLRRMACVEDPVDDSNLSFQTSVTDAHLSATGVGFDFVRSYDSSGNPQGWTYSLFGGISFDTSVTPNTATVSVGAAKLQFTKRTDGTWAPPASSTATLTQSGTTYTLTAEDRTAWTFSGPYSQLQSVTKNGQTMHLNAGSYWYAPSGMTLPDGRIVGFTWNADGALTKITLPDGRFVSYGLDARDNMTSVTDLRGGVTHYTYDSYNRLLTIVDPRGNTVVTNTYDTADHLTSQTDALGHVTTFSYEGGCGVTGATEGVRCGPSVTTETDPRGDIWKDTFNYDGSLASNTDPLGNVTSYADDATSGDPTSETDPLGNVVSFQYDGNHHLTQTTLPGPITTSATYTTAGDLATSTNGRGYTTSYTYDGNGNPTLITRPGGATVSMTYDTKGELTGITDETSHTTCYTYDSYGDRTSSTTALGNKTTYVYDASGRLSSIVDPRGNVTGADPNQFKTTFTYDAGDEVKTVTDPLGHVTTYSYDADGNLSSVTDPNNHTWSYTYDAANRLTKVTAPDLTTTTYAYDAAGNLTSRTDANGHATLYTYDADNRLIKVVDPLNRQWVLGYDADSNLVSVTTPSSGVITYTYDTLGHRTGVGYSDGTPSVTWTYDADGNRASMTDGAGTTSYTYDQLDRLTQATRGTDAFLYSYDAAGRIASRTYPDSTSTAYTYDNDGRMATATVGTATTSYQYDPASNLTQTTLPNGVVESATYDHAGQLTQLNDGFRTFGYGYDSAGNVNSRTVGGVTTTYAYDPLDRLTDITAPTSAIHYGYDAVGDRTAMTDATGSTGYTYDAGDELTTIAGPGGTTSYGYDANGNETSAGPWTYTFNLANQLTAASNGTTSVSYSYDGDHNRVTSIAGGATTSLLWDANFALPQLAIERDGTGGLLRRYTYAASRISMTTPQTTAYYSADAVGSVTELSGNAGSPLGQFDTNPFGDGATASNVDLSVAGNPFGYAGEYRDPATGLIDLRARRYDPTTGRFLSLDPLAPQNHANAYSYVADNPLGFIDPSGMRRTPSCSFLCSVGGTVVQMIHHPLTAGENVGCYSGAVGVFAIGFGLGSAMAAGSETAAMTGWDLLELGLRPAHFLQGVASGGLLGSIPTYYCYKLSERFASGMNP